MMFVLEGQESGVKRFLIGLAVLGCAEIARADPVYPITSNTNLLCQDGQLAPWTLP